MNDTKEKLDIHYIIRIGTAIAVIGGVLFLCVVCVVNLPFTGVESVMNPSWSNILNLQGMGSI